MFQTPFHKKLSRARRKLGMLQCQLAEACGIAPSRLSDLETGRRLPTDPELQRIQRRLRLGDFFLPPSAFVRNLRSVGAQWLDDTAPYFSHQDRPTFVRYRSCLRDYGDLAKQLRQLVAARPDFDICQQLCHLLSCDSSLEVLNLLNLLSLGAQPGFLQPGRLGHTPCPIVDGGTRSEVGHRPHPCLRLGNSIYFFQVTFQAARQIRVDVLRWNNGWRVFELNGEGHSPRGDDSREAELRIPVSWIAEPELLRQIRGSLSAAARTKSVTSQAAS